MLNNAEKGILRLNSNKLIFIRWHNHLDPLVRKSSWNEDEEFIFLEAHKLYGNQWSEIAKMIPGR